MKKYRRRPYRKRRYAKKTNKQVWKNKRDLKWLKRGIEMKRLDGDSNLRCSTSAYNEFFFNTDIYREVDTAAGGGDVVLGAVDKRDGDKIQNRSLMIRGYFDNSTGVTAPEDVIVRVMIGKMIDSVAGFDDSTVLHDETSVNSLRQITDAANIKVLFDHTFSMDHVNFQQIPFKLRLKLRDITEYHGQSTSQTDTDVKRNLYWLLVSSNASEENDAPFFRFHYRFSYTDA